MAAFYAGFPGKSYVCNHVTLTWRRGLRSYGHWFCFLDSLFIDVETVPVRTVNRQCSSGLQAVADVVAAIKAGFYDIGNCNMLILILLHSCFILRCWITVFRQNRDRCRSGIHVIKFYWLGRASKPQSMDFYKHPVCCCRYSACALITHSSLQVNEFQKAQDCLLPMGITSENVAHRYGVTRQEQDQAAVSS